MAKNIQPISRAVSHQPHNLKIPMEQRTKNTDTKIIIAIVCLIIGFLCIWNISAHITKIYELHLDTATCNQVKTLGIKPSENCVITAPYLPFGIIPGGALILPDGGDIQITPIAANQTNQSMAWSFSMKAQFWTAMLFWTTTLVLLLSAFRKKQ